MTKTLNRPIQAAMGRMAMGSLSRPVLGQMGRLGFGHQYTTQMKVLMKKKKDFWPKLADR